MLTEPTAPARPAPRMPGRILVIEDDASFRDCMVLALRKRGFLVYAAPDGESALARLAEQSFDAIVLDLLLPRLTGLELLGALRARTERIPPVVVVSGLRVALAQESYLRSSMGVRALLPKPVGLREFLDTIEGVLERARIELAGTASGGAVVPAPEGFRVLHQGFDDLLVRTQAALPDVKLLIRSAASQGTLEDGIRDRPDALLVCALGDGETAATTISRVRASVGSRFLVLAAGDTEARGRAMAAGATTFFNLPQDTRRVVEFFRAHSAYRRHLRARFHGGVEITDGTTAVIAEGIDISESGICATMEARLLLLRGEIVPLKIALPDTTTRLDVHARIVRLEAVPGSHHCRIAFEFVNPTAVLRNRMRTYVSNALRLSSYRPATTDGSGWRAAHMDQAAAG